MMSPNILVTGGDGLVASALKKILPKALYATRKDADLTDSCQARLLFKKYKPKAVIHLAAKVAGVKTNADRNADMFTENVQINTNVLAAAQEYGVEKLVTALSNCVFRENPPAPPTEKEIYEGLPYAGHAGYGFAKRALDLQIQLLRRQYGSRFTSIMPVTLFGPNDNWDPRESHVAGSLIRKCFLAKKEGKPLEVWGSGRAVRQFVYSRDVARFLTEVLENYDDPETIIVAPNEGITIKELAEAVAKAFDFKGKIVYDASKPEGELKRVLNGSKLKKLFPRFEFTPMEKALKETVDWYVEHETEKSYANS